MIILRWIGALLLPMFSRPRLSPGLVWFIHLLLVAGIAVGLWFVNHHFAVAQSIDTQFFWLKPIWLPLVFLLLYFIAWQAWWVWKLLQPEAIASEFPDLDDAWGEVVDSLQKAGIGVGDTPVFLVFGRVNGADEALFQGLPGGLVVTGGSPTGSPVRAFANRDAVYVTCVGASLLGNPVVVSDTSGAAVSDSIGSGRGGHDFNASIGMDKSIGMLSAGGIGGGDIGRVQTIIRRAGSENRSLSEAEKNEIRKLSSGGAGPAATTGGAAAQTLMQDPAEVEYRLARLRHLCALIARSRWPLCPINGAIVYIPVTDCEKEEVAQQVGLIARQDLQTAEETFRLKFPVYALLGRLEVLPGAPEFLTRFAADRRAQRFGKGFPLAPDLPPPATTDAIEKSARWVFNSLMPYWTFKLFGVERGTESAAGSTKANAELFQFLNAVRSRGEAVARLVGRMAAPGESGPQRFAGCYLTANLPEIGPGPLFVDDFFKKVGTTQGFVAWTDAAFVADARHRRLTKAGYVFIAVVVVGVLALAGFVGLAPKQPK